MGRPKLAFDQTRDAQLLAAVERLRVAFSPKISERLAVKILAADLQYRAEAPDRVRKRVMAAAAVFERVHGAAMLPGRVERLVAARTALLEPPVRILTPESIRAACRRARRTASICSRP